MSLNPFGNYNVDLENVYIKYGEWVESEEWVLEEEKLQEEEEIRYIDFGNHIKKTKEVLKDVRNFKKTTLVKVLCKQENIPTDLEFIIIKFCF